MSILLVVGLVALVAVLLFLFVPEVHTAVLKGVGLARTDLDKLTADAHAVAAKAETWADHQIKAAKAAADLATKHNAAASTAQANATAAKALASNVKAAVTPPPAPPPAAA